LNNADLFSNRCPPFRALAPTISSLADKYAGRVTVCKVDIDRVPERLIPGKFAYFLFALYNFEFIKSAKYENLQTI